MSFSQFNFKREVIVLSAIWIICILLLKSSFPGNPYQGQPVFIYYTNLIYSTFYPTLFFFFIYLSLWSIVELLMAKIKKANKTQVSVIEPEEPVN